MRTALVITTYNWPVALDRVLASTLRQRQLPNEVIVADDGSGQETRKLVDGYKKVFPIPLHHSWQEDRGFRVAMSRNKAIAKSSSDYVILADGDMILHPDFVGDHVQYAERGTFVQGSRAKLSERGTSETIASGNILFTPLTRGLKSRRYAIKSRILQCLFSGRPLGSQITMIQTCNMAFFRDDCLAVNGFNEDFEGWGREDTEFGVRLINSGVTRRNLKFSGIAYHLHHEGESRASLPKNDEILARTIFSRAVRCENGIDKYLAVTERRGRADGALGLPQGSLKP
jgi:glycosyltransferase involved in cell wall biosynthesis